MADKLEVLENEKRLKGSTLNQFAQSEASEARGRFSAISNPTVIGSEPTARYPQLPASSPWAGPDLVPTEPPLGYAIDALNPSDPEQSLSQDAALATPDPEPSQVPPLVERPGSGSFSSRIFRRF
jgi:hypothetical protein